MNDFSTNGNVKHKKKSKFNEGMPGLLLKNVLWEILLEMSNRQLDSPGLKGELWAGDVDLGYIMGQIVSPQILMLKSWHEM